MPTTHPLVSALCLLGYGTKIFVSFFFSNARSSSKSNANEEKKETGSCDINNDENQDSSKCKGYNENQEEDPIPESKLARVFRGWLSTSSLRGITRNGSEGRGPSTSRFAPNCLVGGSGSRTKYIGLKHGRTGRKME